MIAKETHGTSTLFAKKHAEPANHAYQAAEQGPRHEPEIGTCLVGVRIIATSAMLPRPSSRAIGHACRHISQSTERHAKAFRIADADSRSLSRRNECSAGPQPRQGGTESAAQVVPAEDPPRQPKREHGQRRTNGGCDRQMKFDEFTQVSDRVWSQLKDAAFQHAQQWRQSSSKRAHKG